MKIDYDLINSYKQLGVYKSKAALGAYAEEEFGLKIQRNLSFENMIVRLEEHVKASSPITKFILNEPKTDVDLEVLTVPKVETFELDVADVNPEDAKKIVDSIKEQLTGNDISALAKQVASRNEVAKTIEEILPPDFKPCFTPMGNIETFYPLSYWINDWIQEHENWKEIIHEYPRIQEHKFLYTLLYYIHKHGSFTIRETRNGAYITLK